MKLLKKIDLKRKLKLIPPAEFLQGGHTDVDLYEYAKTLVARFKVEKLTEEEARMILDHADNCHKYLRCLDNERNTDTE